jgi:hypothetical protein
VIRAAVQGQPVTNFYQNASDTELAMWADESRRILRNLEECRRAQTDEVVVQRNEVRGFLAFCEEEQLRRIGVAGLA